MASSQAFTANATALTHIWNFPKLKGQENYQAWSKKMKSALKYSGLWKIVEEGIASFPDDLPIDPAPSNTQVEAYNMKMKAWKDINNQASELIYSMCEDNPADAIEDETVAMNRWAKLEGNYTDSGFVLRFTKLQELWSTTFSTSGNSIETYVANIRTKSKDLNRMGAKIDDWILVALLLNNLDVKYKDFVHRLLTQVDEVPEFDKIVILLQAEDRLLQRDSKEQAMSWRRARQGQRDGRGPCNGDA